MTRFHGTFVQAACWAIDRNFGTCSLRVCSDDAGLLSGMPRVPYRKVEGGTSRWDWGWSSL